MANNMDSVVRLFRLSRIKAETIPYFHFTKDDTTLPSPFRFRLHLHHRLLRFKIIIQDTSIFHFIRILNRPAFMTQHLNFEFYISMTQKQASTLTPPRLFLTIIFLSIPFLFSHHKPPTEAISRPNHSLKFFTASCIGTKISYR